MAFNVTILGCGSATPSLKHLPSCQIVEHNGSYFMVDCGEGAQLSLRRAGIKFGRLRHIFISHLHGDHILGLPGFLSSLSLHDFTGEMHVYMMPQGIEVIKQIMRVFAHTPGYTLVFHALECANHVVYEDDAITVSTFPLDHGVPAVGFIFREKPPMRHLRADMMDFYNVPVSRRHAIKAGADFVTDDGRIIPNSWLTTDPQPAASYAYASDTAYSQDVADAVKGVDTLYHEATYANDRADKAAQRKHSTAEQAARVAKAAGARRLVIGHFSKSYNSDESTLLSEACAVFPDTIMAREGMKLKVTHG